MFLKYSRTFAVTPLASSTFSVFYVFVIWCPIRVVDKTWNGHWVGTVDKTMERQPENRYFCVFYALFGVFFSSKSAWIVVSQKIVLEPPFLWCSLTLFHWLINENNQAQSKISWKCSILAWKLVKIDQKHRSRVLSTVPEFCPFQTFCPFQVLSTTLVEKTPKTLKNTPKRKKKEKNPLIT